MARRHHSGRDSRRLAPGNISSCPASLRSKVEFYNSPSDFTVGGPGFIFAAGGSVSSEFPKHGGSNCSSRNRNGAAEEANTRENSGYSFAVGVNQGGDRFSKPVPGKKSSHCRSKNVSHKKPSLSASNWKSSLDSAMKNLSMNDKGNDSAGKDDGNVFVFRGKGKENVSADGECHPRESEKPYDFGVFTFDAKLASCNVREDTLFGADCNKAEGVSEFRMGKGCSKTSKARHRLRRKQKNSSTQKNGDESSSYSPMEYSPCEKAFPQSLSVDQKAPSGFVFAVGTADKASVKRRFRRKKTKKTAHFGGFSNTQEEEESDLKGRNYIEKVDACEEWRNRGNEAFKNGDFSKAEEFYTKGISEAASCETSDCLVTCYSDRAAAKISLGKIREAINDCISATSLDATCTKANLTAANCYLLMGEANKATIHYKKTLENAGEVCLDRRTAIEAANGLHQSQKLADLIESAGKFLETKSGENALETVEKALFSSPYSEELLALKAYSMLMLTRYEEAIELCENTLHSALKNLVKTSELEDSSCKIWRWFLMAKCYFFMGSLDKSNGLLDKILKLNPRDLFVRALKTDIQSISSFAFAVRDLISQKSAGNEAYKSGKYSTAIQHYSNALSANVQSRQFAAICFCNRAAAYQAAGQIADAIADCSLAIALDPNYAKALTRRSILFEVIRDFEQAAADQRRLVQSGVDGKQAQRRLNSLVDSSKNETSLDLYLILGVKKSDSLLDIKKAYRKAALRHHPDKACQYLTRCESNQEAAIWGAILKEVHVDADRLFKMIGQAYSVLSDVYTKQQYDLDEEKRKRKSGNEKESPKQPPTRRWSNQRKWTRENYFYSEGGAW